MPPEDGQDTASPVLDALVERTATAVGEALTPVLSQLSETLKAVHESLDSKRADTDGVAVAVEPERKKLFPDEEQAEAEVDGEKNMLWLPFRARSQRPLTEPEFREHCLASYILVAAGPDKSPGGMLKSCAELAKRTGLTPADTSRVMGSVEKALSEGSAAGGGYLVPDDFRAEVVMRVPALSELFSGVRVIPTARDGGSMPSLATDVSVSWDEGENEDFEDSSPVLGTVTWSIHRMNAICKSSRELMADSAIGLAAFLQQLFTEAVAKERDKVIAIGNGSDRPLGISSASITQSVSVGALSYDKMVDIEHALPKKYRASAAWVLDNTMMGYVMKVKDDNGLPIFRRTNEVDKEPVRVMGYPVREQDDLPSTELHFGDMSRYLWWDREEMGVESTTEGGESFQKHQYWIKVWEREDGKLSLVEAFAKGTNITAPA